MTRRRETRDRKLWNHMRRQLSFIITLGHYNQLDEEERFYIRRNLWAAMLQVRGYLTALHDRNEREKRLVEWEYTLDEHGFDDLFSLARECMEYAEAAKAHG